MIENEISREAKSQASNNDQIRALEDNRSGEGESFVPLNRFDTSSSKADNSSNRAEQEKISNASKELADSHVLGKLEIVAAKKTESDSADEHEEHEADSEPNVNVGRAITWSREARERSRPVDGEGYYQVMERVGKDLLGRDMTPKETMELVTSAKALQKQRGHDSETLKSYDELLPKNEEELSVFMGNFGKRGAAGLPDAQLKELQNAIEKAIKSQSVNPGDTMVYDLKPVKDQPLVTGVVPNAVYIDSSHIEGGQGYRRNEKCEKETQQYWLSKSTAEALMRVQQALLKAGEEPVVLRSMNGAGRRALDRELIKKCAPNQPHAKRRSQHEFGISIDVDNYDNEKVRKALEKEGFIRNVPGDRPHFTRLK